MGWDRGMGEDEDAEEGMDKTERGREVDKGNWGEKVGKIRGSEDDK